MIDLYGLAMDQLDYDQVTGLMHWKYQPNAGYNRNARWAGRPAFTAKDRNGYHIGKLGGITYRADRVAWLMRHGEWREDIYHRNGNKADDSIINLCAYSLRSTYGYPPIFKAEMERAGYKFV